MVITLQFEIYQNCDSVLKIQLSTSSLSPLNLLEKQMCKTTFVSLRIHAECRKIRTRKNSVFGHLSRNVQKSDQEKVISAFA